MKIKNLNDMGKCSRYGIGWSCDSDNYDNGTITIHYKYKNILKIRRHENYPPVIINKIMDLLQSKMTKKQLLNQINLIIMEN